MPVDFKKHQPNTLAEAVQILFDSMDDQERKHIATKGVVGMHHFLGMAMRNNWGLWTGSKLQEHFKKIYGIGHADDMSGMILDALECLVHGRFFDPCKEAERYHKFWRDQGIDPLTLKEINAN